MRVSNSGALRHFVTSQCTSSGSLQLLDNVIFLWGGGALQPMIMLQNLSPFRPHDLGCKSIWAMHSKYRSVARRSAHRIYYWGLTKLAIHQNQNKAKPCVVGRGTGLATHIHSHHGGLPWSNRSTPSFSVHCQLTRYHRFSLPRHNFSGGREHRSHSPSFIFYLALVKAHSSYSRRSSNYRRRKENVPRKGNQTPNHSFVVFLSLLVLN